MNILADFHHSDLWWSNHLIFEKALGHKLFRPRGMEWYEKGYYNRQSRDIAKQFLVDSMFKVENAAQYPSFKAALPLNAPSGLRASMDAIAGSLHYPYIKTLAFAEFADAKIDAIMATLSDNQEPWAYLRKDLKPKAKLIREEGNVHGWASLHPEYMNVLTSDLPTFQKANVKNKLLYHQRFDTENVFTYSEPTVFDRITCFMPGFRGCPELVAFAERHDFSGIEFVDYGHHSKRGFLSTKESYAEAMRQTSLVWHVKPGGDGFGHVLHNSFAMGRPVITVLDDYRGSIAFPLLVDDGTCILLGRDVAANSSKIRAALSQNRIVAMSRAARDRFKAVVNYEAEAVKIAEFLSRLE